MMRLLEIRLDAARIRRAAGIYTQEELANIAIWNPPENNTGGDAEPAPAALTAPLLAENNFVYVDLEDDEDEYDLAINDEDPLDYYDPDADDPYDLELAFY